MQVQYKTTARQTRITLSGELTIYQVADVKALLLDEAKGLDKKVLLDLSRVEELDTAGVQLLFMLKKLVLQQGGTLAISDVSESARNILDCLNCSATFGLSEAAA